MRVLWDSANVVGSMDQRIRSAGPSREECDNASGLRGCGHVEVKAAHWTSTASDVRRAFAHAWLGYCQYAWGFDELKPVSQKGINNFGGLGISILDSLTTLWLLDLPQGFERAEGFVRDELNFGKLDQDVSVFELTIRALGGLLGAHALSDRPIFLQRARELAEQVLPAFDTPSQLPWPYWNLHRGNRSASPSQAQPSSIADAGTLQLEWRYLGHATDNPQFSKAVDSAFEAIQTAGVKGLLPSLLTPPWRHPTAALPSKITVGGTSDSYYEYLLKQWLLSGGCDRRYKELFLDFMEDLPRLLNQQQLGPGNVQGRGAQTYRLFEVSFDNTVTGKMEHLGCVVPGLIALALLTLPEDDLQGQQADWMALAEGLTASCVEMWTSTQSGLAPEHVHHSPDASSDDHAQVPMDGQHSLLRPETAETLFYMFRLTGNETYRHWGERLFRALQAHSRTSAAFSSVADVNRVPTVKADSMHSFVLAETFKYLYLLFAPPSTLDLSKFVLSTEAHPLRVMASCNTA